MREFCVLRASVPDERQNWHRLWQGLPEERRDAYMAPEFPLASEVEGRGEACCAVLSTSDAVWMYPFLKCPIASSNRFGGTPLFDIQTAYGYGGPVVNAGGEDPAYLAIAWSQFDTWCARNRVVAEFVRLHPLLNNYKWCHPDSKVTVDRITVPVDVRSYPQAVWNSAYFRVHRNMIRRAERAGLDFSWVPAVGRMDWFRSIYAETQDRLEAAEETRFGRCYFEALAAGFGERAWLGIVRRAGTIGAAVLVLHGATMAHCHLMGYATSGETGGMHNLLYHGVFVEAARRGANILHMGGGRTSDEQDSLFRFKKSLSPLRATYRRGTRVYNKELYLGLISEWEAKHGPVPKNYFLAYRLPAGRRRTSLGGEEIENE